MSICRSYECEQPVFECFRVKVSIIWLEGEGLAGLVYCSVVSILVLLSQCCEHSRLVSQSCEHSRKLWVFSNVVSVFQCCEYFPVLLAWSNVVSILSIVQCCEHLSIYVRHEVSVLEVCKLETSVCHANSLKSYAYVGLRATPGFRQCNMLEQKCSKMYTLIFSSTSRRSLDKRLCQMPFEISL